MVFKKFFTGNIKPHFRFSQNGNIWRLYLNHVNIIVGETRDIKNKESYIFSLDYLNKKVYLKNFRFKEKWWFAIDGVNNKYIFISHFKNPEQPEHKGFEIIDIKTGNKKWGNDELEFFFADEQELYALKPLFESFIIYNMNIENGEVTGEFKDEEQRDSILDLKYENDINIYEGLMNTSVFSFDDKILKDKYSSLINRVQSLKINGDIEYIEKGQYLIYNYHQSKEINLKDINSSFLTNKLEILETLNNNIIYEDTLNSVTSSYVPDSFFVKNNMLFYVKEKKELIVVDLSSS